MEKNQEIRYEPSVVEWSSLLFQHFDYEAECKKLFPMNPPDPWRCIKLIDLLEDTYIEDEREEEEGMIVVCDHGHGKEKLPLVYVINGKDEKLALDNFSYHDLLTMLIVVDTKKKMSKEQLLILLCFYILYPLRVGRQKKRDSVSMLLNVLCQYAEHKK